MSEENHHNLDESRRALEREVADDAVESKHTEDIRLLVDVSSLRLLLIATPLGSAFLYFASQADSSESTVFHIMGAAIFAVPFSIFMLVRIFKAGYLVLDPKRGQLIYSGRTTSFSQLSDPQLGSSEVEFMSTQWQPMRGKGEGLQIAPGKIILFNTGHSRRKLQQIADLLAEMLEEYNAKHKVGPRPFP